MTLGDAIRQAYEHAGSKQEVLAAGIHVDQATVSKWVRGKNIPPLPRLWDVEDFLHLQRGTILVIAGLVPTEAEEPTNVVELPRPTRQPAQRKAAGAATKPKPKPSAIRHRPRSVPPEGEN